MSCTTDRARILVLGDSGVGKTSLVHLIAHGKPLSQIAYTVGAAIEVKLHELDVHTYPLDGDNIRDGINKNLTRALEARLIEHKDFFLVSDLLGKNLLMFNKREFIVL